MKALLQRVAKAAVSVDLEVIGSIDRGLVVFLGVGKEDSEADARYLAQKIASLRIFPDEADKLNLSVADIGGQILVVSQFTLLADARKGRRPSFVDAAPPEEAEPLFEKFVSYLRETGLRIETGRFRVRMLVEIYNEGPVTIMLDSKA